MVRSELMCTSITSTGNGTGSTTEAMTADFRVLDYVTTPGSPVSTLASFAIQDSVPGLQAR
ncbi:hypothetical protein J2808_002282 [Pseudarthrobacter sulfonivorans]|nr:hypothetical protein [Pseudarthrobacter sulfonivorans]